ncbi:MAG: outer membrane protein assembly factor BamE [Erythrobacter sp.]
MTGSNTREARIQNDGLRSTGASRLAKAALLAGALAGLGACSSIRESRGYVTDQLLLRTVQPGIDNQRSVEGTLGRPTFASQYGEPTWYYVSSITGRRPFVRPRIKTHGVLAVKFDEAGNVSSVERTGVDKVVYLQPNGNKTPTLGRERGFLEDLFGNIGQVGAGGGPGGPGPGGV